MDGLNILDGNCVVGGLLPLGRQQHHKNGLCVISQSENRILLFSR